MKTSQSVFLCQLPFSGEATRHTEKLERIAASIYAYQAAFYALNIGKPPDMLRA